MEQEGNGRQRERGNVLQDSPGRRKCPVCLMIQSPFVTKNSSVSASNCIILRSVLVLAGRGLGGFIYRGKYFSSQPGCRGAAGRKYQSGNTVRNQDKSTQHFLLTELNYNPNMVILHQQTNWVTSAWPVEHNQSKIIPKNCINLTASHAPLGIKQDSGVSMIVFRNDMRLWQSFIMKILS